MQHTLQTAMIAAVAVTAILICGCNQTADSSQAVNTGTADSASGGPSLETKATGVVDMLAKAEFAGVVGTFDTTMKSALPESKLRDTWSALTQQAGPFQSRGKVRTTREQGFDAVYVECKFERATLNAKVVFNSSGEVSGFFLQNA